MDAPSRWWDDFLNKQMLLLNPIVNWEGTTKRKCLFTRLEVRASNTMLYNAIVQLKRNSNLSILFYKASIKVSLGINMLAVRVSTIWAELIVHFPIVKSKRKRKQNNIRNVHCVAFNMTYKLHENTYLYIPILYILQYSLSEGTCFCNQELAQRTLKAKG